VKAGRASSWAGRLAELDIRRRFQVLVVAIKRGRGPAAATGRGERLQSGDVLVLVGRDADLDAADGLAAAPLSDKL